MAAHEGTLRFSLVLLCVCTSCLAFAPFASQFASKRSVAVATMPALRVAAPAGLQLAISRRAKLSLPPLAMSSLAELREDFLDEKKPKVPVSLLSGFLGSGKTTLLREVLENKGGYKVGVVVNDMAAVNIDSKLVKSDAMAGKQAEISGALVDTSEVMELQNGCACCTASDELAESLLQLLAVAVRKGEMFDRIVIEASGVSEPKAIRRVFFELMMGGHPVFDFCDLQNMVTVVDSGNFLPLYESSSELLERPELLEDEDSSMEVATRQVVDLLTDQVETADYVLLNKKDKVNDQEMSKLQSIVKALNPTADVIACEHGKVDLKVVLGSEREHWVAMADDEDDFRKAVTAAKTEAAAACGDPTCTDPSHAHSHSDSDSHSHSHSESHSHSDSHSHSHSESTSSQRDDTNSPEAKFGISSFVYSRRTPFDTERLKRCILELPVIANSEQGTQWQIPTDKGEAAGGSSMRKVIRSKGFVWLNNNHRKPLYWSHAGHYFDLKDFGMFWASTPLDFWPRDRTSLDQIVNDFGGPTSEWGDRRQELVFIGVGMNERAICDRLDTCLLTEAEMKEYAEAAQAHPDAVKLDYASTPPKPVQAR